MISVSHWGTFDVANYGDLIFPSLLQTQLNRRLEGLNIRLFSPDGGSCQGGQPTERITRFEEEGFYQAHLPFQAVILGGGDLIRFDDEALSRLYNRDEDDGLARWYRLFLYDLGKIARMVPVFWNCMGVPFDFQSEQYEEVRRGVKFVTDLTVRDHTSKMRLEAAGVDREIHVVPDSAFLLSETLPSATLQKAVDAVRQRKQFPVTGRVLTVQASSAYLEAETILARALSRILDDNQELNLVLLPMGACHGDKQILSTVNSLIGNRGYLVEPESVVEIAAVIANSTFFAGSSFHGLVTSAVYDVGCLPFARRQGQLTKLEDLAEALGLECCVAKSAEALTPHFARLIDGVSRPDQLKMEPMKAALNQHFDRLASSLIKPRPQYSEAYWLGCLEDDRQELIAMRRQVESVCQDLRLRAKLQGLKGR